MTVGERIIELRNDLNISQKELSEKIQLNTSVLSRIESNKRPIRDDELLALSNALNTSIDYLLGKTRDPHVNKKAARIPVYSSVAAGSPLLANDQIVDWAEIPANKAVGNDYFGLYVKGMSMYPTFQEGDLLIVKKQNDVDSGDLAIVLVNGDEATFKQVQKKDNGILLVGYNTAVYTPKFYDEKDILTLPVHIIGKVVEFRREL